MVAPKKGTIRVGRVIPGNVADEYTSRNAYIRNEY